MSPKISGFIAICLASTSVFSPSAEAARLGGGKSSGMTRSYSPAPTRSYAPPPKQSVQPRSTPSYSQPVPAPRQYYQHPAPAPAKKSGPGWGGVAAGAAAGAAAGYMLGNSGSSHQVAPSVVQQAPQPQAGQYYQQGQSQQQAPDDQPIYRAPPVQSNAPIYVSSSEPKSSFPWGTLFFLSALGIGGYLYFRRKAADTTAGTLNYAGMPSPSININHAFKVAGSQATSLPSAHVASTTTSPSRLADGTETVAFLRQAKASFMHLQTMNSSDSVEEVRRYMTPELFASMKEQIEANKETAEFPELQAELVESVKEANQYVATVRFYGMVSEDLNAQPEAFEELWHFVKPIDATAVKWLVAGVQQV